MPGASERPASMGVRMMPGHTALTRMPCAPYSIAAVRVSPTTACFAAS